MRTGDQGTGTASVYCYIYILQPPTNTMID